MPINVAHRETHRTDRIGWLRAGVHGANDGIISTASLLIGVAAANASHATLMTTGVAGMVAGAMSMAVSEYVSVGSQADTQKADLDRERRELLAQPEHEKQELTSIYVARGLSPALAAQVADELTAHDALGAHARDELGITDAMTARPMLRRSPPRARSAPAPRCRSRSPPPSLRRRWWPRWGRARSCSWCRLARSVRASVARRRSMPLRGSASWAPSPWG